MNIDAVLTELATALDTIAGLRVYDHVPDAIAPPAALVAYAEHLDYQISYGRGMDRIDWPIIIAVGRVSDRTAPRRLAPYLSGSGASSIKAALDGGTYTACDDVTVVSAENDVLTVGSIDYIAAAFTARITGSGN